MIWASPCRHNGETVCLEWTTNDEAAGRALAHFVAVTSWDDTLKDDRWQGLRQCGGQIEIGLIYHSLEAWRLFSFWVKGHVGRSQQRLWFPFVEHELNTQGRSTGPFLTSVSLITWGTFYGTRSNSSIRAPFVWFVCLVIHLQPDRWTPKTFITPMRPSLHTLQYWPLRKMYGDDAKQCLHVAWSFLLWHF